MSYSWFEVNGCHEGIGYDRESKRTLQISLRGFRSATRRVALSVQHAITPADRSKKRGPLSFALARQIFQNGVTQWLARLYYLSQRLG